MAISASESQLRAIEGLRNRSKFKENPHYPGAPTEDIRIRCESRVNEFLIEIEALLKEGTDEAALYSRARVLEASFAREDTEEREKVGDYIGDAMRILELHDWLEYV